MANTLRSRRLALDLGPVELAARAGISPTTLSLFERGYVPRHSEALPRLERALAAAEAEQRPRFVEFAVPPGWTPEQDTSLPPLEAA